MSKPILERNFWVNRLEEAKAVGALHLSVYRVDSFQHIDHAHREVFEKEKVSGKILDVGCGYGRIASWFDAKQYVGVDFVPEFIDEANKRQPGYDFRVVDLLQPTDFKDKQFDWALCVSIRRMFVDNVGEPQWKIIEKELRRVAKRILIVEYSEPREYVVL